MVIRQPKLGSKPFTNHASAKTVCRAAHGHNWGKQVRRNSEIASPESKLGCGDGGDRAEGLKRVNLPKGKQKGSGEVVERHSIRKPFCLVIHHTNRQGQEIHRPSVLVQDRHRIGERSYTNLRGQTRRANEIAAKGVKNATGNLGILLLAPIAGEALDHVQIVFRSKRLPWSSSEVILRRRHRLLL